MTKTLLLLSCLLAFKANALNQNEALEARNAAIQALSTFKPQLFFKGFKNNLNAPLLEPHENKDTLNAQAVEALKNNSASKELYEQAINRAKVRPNSNSTEARYAERLLEQSEQVLKEGCFQIEGVCLSQKLTKNCLEDMHYDKESCKETLSLQVKSQVQNISRRLYLSSSQSIVTIDLQSCSAHESNCTSINKVQISPSCEKLDVSVLANQKPLTIITGPTCTQPQVTVAVYGLARSTRFDVNVTQSLSEEHWENHCDLPKECVLKEAHLCLEPNAIKIIDGLSIERSCWTRSDNYLCTRLNSSTCTDLMNQGCSQIGSECVEANEGLCLQYSQSFQCDEQHCETPQTICPGKLACADGSCDTSKDEASDDIKEGVSRLGLLAGSADTVSEHQIKDKMPAIFTGTSQECKEYPLGFRDCCKDSGWGEWIKNCPTELQDLQKAKSEKRAVYLGHYYNHVWEAEHYTFCIFPNKLAAILQIEGRSQLGLSYGSAEFPNCRGLTADELAKIDFAKLDLSEIEQELVNRMRLPNGNLIYESNQSHIESLKEKGRSHD